MSDSSKSKLIGGTFAYPKLPKKHLCSEYDFLCKKNLFMANARSVLIAILKIKGISKIWLPSFCCSSVVKALLNDFIVKFYPIDYNLKVIKTEWLHSLDSVSAFVHINYFGFTETTLFEEIINSGVFIVEDASQSLLSFPRSSLSHITIFSPRKFVGVPDGGISIINRNINFRMPKLKEIPHSWLIDAVEMLIQRREFDELGGPKTWYDLFNKTKETIPIGNYKMSSLTYSLLREGFDYDEISIKRVKNYNYLFEQLSDLAIFGPPTEGQVPLGFPIRCINRDKVKLALYEKNIFPPIHWIIKNHIPDDFIHSHRLSNHILTIPCDQRYDEDDMKRIVNIIKKNL